jgi:2-dehydro-3-deoxy-D-arabinonate dehydratase
VKIYRTTAGAVLEQAGKFYALPDESWDALLNRENLFGYLSGAAGRLAPADAFSPADALAPVGTQEVWAAGVTYFRSRTARMEESKDAGGGDFYDRVYSAERPELFFKANPHRVAGPGRPVKIRRDSKWNVPEPELALAVNSRGEIVGYTVGNDMSSRDIEGENPLYLPQLWS